MLLVSSVCWEVSPPSSDLLLPVKFKQISKWFKFESFFFLFLAHFQVPYLTWRKATTSRFGSPEDFSLFLLVFRSWYQEFVVTWRRETLPSRLQQFSKKIRRRRKKRTRRLRRGVNLSSLIAVGKTTTTGCISFAQPIRRNNTPATVHTHIHIHSDRIRLKEILNSPSLLR